MTHNNQNTKYIKNKERKLKLQEKNTKLYIREASLE